MRLLRRWIGGQSTGTPPECKRTFKRRLHRGLTSIRRYGSLNFAELVGKPFPKYQIYVSSSSDPYLNLSIEHFLLQKTPKDSTILYFYVNRPCVVIGRNQNPWVEANLRALVSSQVEAKANDQAVTEPILLVRRRSGGGTVFHDQGNVNYCVICPSAEFTRDKHAMMVATALRSIGVSRARVNRRHDIVLDSEVEDESIRSSSPVGSHLPAKDIERARLPKISGSAYKLTRGRCLHHGTCLLSSPNLHRIPWILRSPAKPYIKAKGVESISSPVSNVNVSMEAFRKAVMEAFGNLYGLNIDSFTSFPQKQGLHEDLGWAGGVVNETEIHVPEIERGVKELMSPEWIYLQTPQFTFSSPPLDTDDGTSDLLRKDVPMSAHFSITVRYGKIESSTVSLSANSADARKEASAVDRLILGQQLHAISDWKAIFRGCEAYEDRQGSQALGRWLNSLLVQDNKPISERTHGDLRGS